MDPFEGKGTMPDFNEDQIEWTEEKYSLTTFREKGRFKLPTLIHITSGYFGKDDSDTFSSDDILVLYEWKMQERVLAKKGKFSTSIPLDFEHKLEVMEPGKPRRMMHLSQIVQKYKPPVQVRFGPDTNGSFTLAQNDGNAEDVGPFTLMSSHILEYATASSTVKGKISTEELECLPIHRKVRFVVATRLHGIPMEQHSQYFHSFLENMEPVRTLGALQYTELLDTMDEYDYIRTIPSGTWGKPRNDIVHTNKSRQYTLLQKVDLVPDYEPIETNHMAREKVTDPAPRKEKPSAIKKGGTKRPHLPHELPTRLTRDDIYIPIDIPTSPTIQRRPIFQEIDPRPTSPFGPIPERPRPVAPVLPTSRSPSISKPHINVKPEVPPRPRNPIPNKSGSASTTGLDLHAATGPWVTSSTPNLSNPSQSPPPSASTMPIPRERKRTIADSTPALLPCVTTSQIKGSVVPPPPIIHTLEDVPADLTALSVDQICQCLALLNLGEFAPSFRHTLIDGRILSGCSVDDLKQEFSMGHLSARKLAMFANDGWRPKE